ncbi:S8 family serine peptidase [Marinifilum fragile]|uniref:S8 family serine peptidase n=1 Tax=Marinifilum fragile TaxID=570161 RepID=UPI002AA82E62|nr:S8 family serine peptidase [Marinifilum fragile]
MKRKIPLIRMIFFFISLNFLSSLVIAQETTDHFVKGVIRVKVSPEAALQIESTTNPARYSVGEFNPTKTGVAGFDLLNVQYQARSLKRVFRSAAKFEKRHQEYGLHLWYEIEVDSTISNKELMEEYGQLDVVEMAEPKVIFKQNAVKSEVGSTRIMEEKANDPLYHNQWHYENLGQTGGTTGADINLRKAWELETGNPDVVVAVIDGGIDINHEDLKANIWINEDEIPDNHYDDDHNGYVDDYHGWNFADNMPTITSDEHGTHVAGTIAAVSNNGKGVAGVAGGSGNGDGVRVMSCQVFGYHPAYGSYSGGFEEAFIYAADNGAVIANNSWGGGMPSQLMVDCIRYYVANAGKDPVTGEFTSTVQGGLPIFAAGNFNSSMAYGVPAYSFPSYIDEVVCVANTDHNDRKHVSSYFNEYVDISAPGTAIHSTLPGNSYGGPHWTGTSMACPHVSGVAALIASKYAYNITAEEIKQRMYNTAKNIDKLNPTMIGYLGAGRIDAYAALLDNAGEVPAIADWGFYSIDENTFDIGWKPVVNKFGIRIVDYNIMVAEGDFANDTVGFESAAQTLSYRSKADGVNEGYFITSLKAATTYTVGIKAKDKDGNLSAVSKLLVATTWKAPTIALDGNDPDTLTVDINVKENPNGFTSFSFENTGEGVSRFWWDVRGFEKGAEVQATTQSTSITQFGSPSLDVTYEPYTFVDSVYHETKQTADSRNGMFLTRSPGQGMVYLNKFVAEKDMVLTHIGAYIATEMYTEPQFGFAIYVGGEDGPDGQPQGSTGKYIRDRRDGGWFYTTLSRDVSVKAGEIFWVAVNAPDGIFYPLGVDFVEGSAYYAKGKSFVRKSDQHYYTDLGYTEKSILKIRAYESQRNFKVASITPNKGDIAPNEKVKVDVTVDGNVFNNGNYVVDLMLRHDDPQKGILVKPVKVNVTGHQPTIALDQEEIDFGVQFFDTTGEIELVLKNKGKANLTGISFEGLNADYFTVTPTSIEDLKPGYSAVVKIQSKKQTVEAEILESLTINSNISAVEIPVLAKYIQGPVLEANVSEIDFGTLESGAQTTASFVLTNTGNYPTSYDFKSFTEGKYTSFTKNLTPSTGLLNPGESVDITFDIDMEGVMGSNYQKSYTLSANYGKKTIGIPVRGYVTGKSVIELPAEAVNFGSVVAGSGDKVAASFVIKNTGTLTASITWGTLSAPFAFDGYKSSTVSAGYEITIKLLYSPLEVGASTQDLTFTIDGQEYVIHLTGTATPSPEAAINWNSDFSSDQLMYNESNGKKGVLSVLNNSSTTELNYSVYAPTWININGEVKKADGFDNGFGYSYKKVPCEWVDISEIGTSVKSRFPSYTTNHIPLNLEYFEFPYFGKKYSQMVLGVRGFVSFDSNISTSFGSSNAALPKSSDANAIIAPFWGPLYFVESSDLLVYQSPDSVIFQWNNVRPQVGPYYYTFQLILYPDGHFKYQYGSMDDYPMYFTVGFEGPKGIYGKSIYYKDYYSAPELAETAFEFLPPVSGTLAAGESKDFNLQYNAAGLAVGEYSDVVRVVTDDINTLSDETAVALTVDGEAIISVERNEVNFENLMYLNDGLNSTTETFSIINDGSKPVPVSSIALEGDVDYFESDLVEGTIVPAFDKVEFTLKYKALDADGHTANLNLNVNAEDYVVTLNGDAVLPPVFGYELPETGRVDTIDWVVNENELKSFEFTLSNTGEEEKLNFDVTLGLAHHGWEVVEENVVAQPLVLAATTVEEIDPQLFSTIDFAPSIEKSTGVSVKSAVHTPTVFADSIAYDLPSDEPLTLMGASVYHINAAVKFTVQQEEGFYLTHVKQFLRRESSTEPFIIEILQGEDINTAQVLLSQDYMGGTVEGAMEIVPLNEQFYFEKGSSFFIKIAYPQNIEYALGLDWDVPSVIHKCFVSSDNGQSWDAISDIFYYTYAFKTRAMSANPNQWLSIDPSFGEIANNGAQNITVNVDASKLEVGDYQAYLHLSHNDPYQKTNKIPVNLRINQGPIMEVSEKQTVNEGEVLHLQIPVTDPEGDVITSVVPVQEYDSLTTSFANGQLELNFSPDYHMAGDYTFTFLTKDEYGAEKSYEVTVEALNVNRAPQVISSIDPREYYEDEQMDNIDLTEVFVDPDGEILTFTAFADDETVVNIFTSEDGMVIKPLKEGTITITAVASDPEGLNAETTFTVTIATVTGIEDINGLQTTKVYPVPTDGPLNIVLGNEIEGEVSISVINLIGRSQFQTTVNKGRGSYTETLDISNLPAGIYLLNIRTSEDVIVKKVIKK